MAARTDKSAHRYLGARDEPGRQHGIGTQANGAPLREKFTRIDSLNRGDQQMPDLHVLHGELVALSPGQGTHDLTHRQFFWRGCLTMEGNGGGRSVVQLQPVHANAGESGDHPFDFNHEPSTATAATIATANEPRAALAVAIAICREQTGAALPAAVALRWRAARRARGGSLQGRRERQNPPASPAVPGASVSWLRAWFFLLVGLIEILAIGHPVAGARVQVVALLQFHRFLAERLHHLAR